MVSRPHHIAFVLPTPFVGGTEHATLRIVKMLDPEMFTSTVFYPDQTGPARSLFESHGVTAIPYSAAEPSYRHPKAYLTATRQLVNEFKRRKIDLVHCCDMLAGSYASLAGRLAGLPVVCHIRCCFENISFRDRTFLYPVNRFVFVSREVQRGFGIKVSPHRATVLYDGVEVVNSNNDKDVRSEVRREFGLPDTTQLIGMVARVAPAKDHATLARAAKEVVANFPNAHFLIIGDHAESSLNQRHFVEITELLRSLDIAEKFTFAGHRDDVVRLLSALDISVLSTHTEGLPLVLLEAMALGKPVLATAVGGVPEVIVNGKTGLLHDHEDAASLAQHMMSLLSNEELAHQLGEAGREHVRSYFSSQSFKSNVTDLYREMLEDR